MTNIENFKNQNIVQQNLVPRQPDLLTKQYNNLERTPSADGFVKQDISTAAKRDSSTKYKIMTAAATIAATGMSAVAIIKGRKAGKLAKQLAENASQLTESSARIKNLEETISVNSETISKLNDEVKNLSEKLKESLDDYIPLSADNLELLNKYQDEYSKKIAEINSSGIIPQTPLRIINDPFAHSMVTPFKFDELTQYKKFSIHSADLLDTTLLKKELATNGKLEVIVDGPVEKIAGDGILNKVLLSDNFEPQKISTNMTIEYGGRTNWSNEKVARDMLQNFFDGHGQTLNGVKLCLEKISGGKIRVRLEGKGLFKPGDVTLIGGGKKDLDSHNAGGFGEGIKVMIARMINQQQTDNVSIRCANWKADFFAQPFDDNNVLMRNLSRTSDTINGNVLEFETADKALVDSIIDAMNYFKHAKNPDYQGLSYDSSSFAFKLLQDKEKGNCYLLQRFEIAEAGKWQDTVDGISLIFKEKPDLEELKKITGYSMDTTRDRTKLNFDDIQHLTHYFAHKNMSDNELMNAIVSTEHLWQDLKPNWGAEKRIHFAFIKGLLKEANSRRLGLDLCGKKYAYDSPSTNAVVAKKLSEYGYKILPYEFSDIKIPDAVDVFKSFSNHRALAYTDIEMKKIALLDEAVKIIQKNISKEFFKVIEDIPALIYNKTLSALEIENTIKALNLSDDVLHKIIGHKLLNKPWYQWTDEECTLLSNKIGKLIKIKIKTFNKNNFITEFKKLMESLPTAAIENLDEISSKYLKKVRDLSLIEPEDVVKPKYIFDRTAETATNTLGEAIINNEQYLGHWIDRDYLKTTSFNEMLATWLHEIHHKSGGDGTAEFTYALTDLIEVLLSIHPDSKSMIKLKAIENVYNQLLKQSN